MMSPLIIIFCSIPFFFLPSTEIFSASANDLNLLERMGVHSYDAMLFMLLVNFCCGHTLLLPTRVNNVLLTIIFTYNGPNNGNQNSTLVQLNIAP